MAKCVAVVNTRHFLFRKLGCRLATSRSIELKNETMCSYIDARVASGHYGNTSEYIRDLVRKDQTEEAKARLCVLIEGGFRPAVPWSLADQDELLAIAKGEIGQGDLRRYDAVTVFIRNICSSALFCLLFNPYFFRNLCRGNS
jgi:antitoxin ParD1/3/4